MGYAPTTTKDRRTIRALIRRGADPNLGRTDGSTPLHLAAAFGDERTVRALQTPLEAAQARPAMQYDARGSRPVSVDAVVNVLRRSRRSVNR